MVEKMVWFNTILYQHNESNSATTAVEEIETKG
jgi:hypothetical protein